MSGTLLASGGPGGTGYCVWGERSVDPNSQRVQSRLGILPCRLSVCGASAGRSSSSSKQAAIRQKVEGTGTEDRHSSYRPVLVINGTLALESINCNWFPSFLRRLCSLWIPTVAIDLFPPPQPASTRDGRRAQSPKARSSSQPPPRRRGEPSARLLSVIGHRSHANNLGHYWCTSNLMKQRDRIDVPPLTSRTVHRSVTRL